ncbi:hypothetical protein PK34_15090 [Stutzerimonas stutzeri]|jgi:hypothetical protein|uniref:hypothetical protein n=1 Tax=Stutzerimonas stutzeri subgroup TaxID=578833 RepID=UPI0005B41980|nr:hypothetical protein [Stutzerimonas kunmingensis]KKJ95397.1 hypothetical protein PK34_15090 [Stutzerimonas stutzeri]MAF86301.1 hypothetical protein [Pseudomonas sp.]MAK87438.1 hypothetical protein [Pseudomonas sp.]MBD3876286.1 hypothetical protein [Stutzerimonas kunmingensis]HAG77614.1 hypothetical protein [Pseudomonas sp.]|tara:strand:- start:484 stop:870 length:387 start_codon:yes stop_codon:yes gene_type:complete
MDRLIRENLEYLLQETSNSKRLGRRIISLAGFLDSAQSPEAVQSQLSRLSRLLILQDTFDALLESLTLMSRANLPHGLDAQAMQSMAKSVEEARKEIADSEEINYPLLVSWLVSAAESRKIMRARKAS